MHRIRSRAAETPSEQPSASAASVLDQRPLAGSGDDLDQIANLSLLDGASPGFTGPFNRLFCVF